MNFRQLAISICLAPLTVLIVGNSTAQPINTAKLDSFFNMLASREQMMGSVAITKGGNVVYMRSLGYSKIDAQQTVSANDTTYYRIGSVTKMFTAAMIFQLIEGGKLSLSSPLSQYFPDIPNAKDITVALLLNHRSGLYDFVNDKHDMAWLAQPHVTDDILKVIAKRKHNAKPDAVFAYSNSAYFLLAKILEQITHQSYDANLQSRICAPLGLRHTYSSRDNSSSANAALPYSFSSGGWHEVTDMWFLNLIGVGDIESTPVDLVAFVNALFNGQLVNAASLVSMKKIVDPPFGMGLMLQPFLGHLAYGHGGDTYGSHASLAHFPNDSLTVAVCINGESFSRYGIYAGILSICFNEEYIIPDFEKVRPNDVLLSAYVGIYSSESSPLKIAVTQKEATLFAKPEGRPASRLIAIMPNVFCFEQSGFFISFRPEKGEMVLSQSGGTTLLKKEP